MSPNAHPPITGRLKVARAAAVLGSLAVLAAGCINDDSVDVQTRMDAFNLLGGLNVGEALSLHGEQAGRVVLPGNTTGAEFAIVLFLGSEEEGTVTVGIDGAELLNVVGPPAGAKISGSGLGSFGRPLSALEAQTERFDERLRRREIERLEPILPSMNRETADLRAQGGSAPAAAVPSVGDILSLQAINDASPDLCAAPLQRGGRVAAVSDKAIVVSDTLSPAELSDAEFADIASEFDDLVLPVGVENFGQPTDIDGNSRIIIFFTPVVNDVNDLGFTFAGDLFAQSDCAASNEAEIVYILSPDPSGQTATQVDAAFVAFLASDIIGHELQHLINAARRIYVNDATELETVWLNEGLSHIAEELLFYATTPFGPGENIDLNGVSSVADEANRFALDDFLFYWSYAASPTEATLTGDDNDATRGAMWAFLRYAADLEERPDSDFFFALANSTTSGFDNLNEVLQSGDALDLMQAWTASVFSDDQVEDVPDFLTQPSWNFRSILPALTQDGTFPLDVQVIDTGGGHAEVSLNGGGSAFFQVRVDPERQGEFRLDVGGAIPEALRVSVVRAQ